LSSPPSTGCLAVLLLRGLLLQWRTLPPPHSDLLWDALVVVDCFMCAGGVVLFSFFTKGHARISLPRQRNYKVLTFSDQTPHGKQSKPKSEKTTRFLPPAGSNTQGYPHWRCSSPNSKASSTKAFQDQSHNMQ
jgi:hypothetical protein